MKQHFVSKRVEVETAGMDPAAMAGGEPPAPVCFTWGEEKLQVVELLASWRGYDQDRTHGSAERYLRRHWFKVRVADGRVMSLYFERHAPRRSSRSAKARKPQSRWYLHSWEPPLTDS